MPETTPLIKAALNLRVGAGFDVYVISLLLLSEKNRSILEAMTKKRPETVLFHTASGLENTGFLKLTSKPLTGHSNSFSGLIFHINLLLLRCKTVSF